MPIIQIRHSLLQNSLAHLRDTRTSAPEFRRHLGRAAMLLVAEAAKEMPMKRVRVRTPLARAEGRVLASPPLVVPILRAGLGMLQPFLCLVPDAVIGFLGLRRDEKTFEPREYYRSLPDRLRGRVVFLLDPMLATGGSLLAALKILRARGASDIRVISLVAAPEGARKVARAYPHVMVYTASIDRNLNRYAYIVPGIGDAGDRFCGIG